MSKIIHIHIGFYVNGLKLKPTQIMQQEIRQKVRTQFVGYNIIWNEGGWEGTAEDSAIIEIHTTPDTLEAEKLNAMAFAKWYKENYQQECVRIKIFDAEIIDI